MSLPPKDSSRPRRFREEVWLRRREVFLHRNMRIALGCAAAYGLCSSLRSPLAPKERASLSDLTAGTFALAGFGFSVALAAVAIVVALPGSRLLQNMLEPSVPGSDRSPYGELVFLFTWTGIVQGVAAGTGMLALVAGGESVLLTIDDPAGLVLGTAVIATSAYALLQLMTAVVTISQVASLQARYNSVDAGFSERDHPKRQGDE